MTRIKIYRTNKTTIGINITNEYKYMLKIQTWHPDTIRRYFVRQMKTVLLHINHVCYHTLKPANAVYF